MHRRFTMISSTTITGIDMTAACIAIFTFIFGLLWMLPCRLVPRVTTALDETVALTGPAEAVGVPMGDYDAELAILDHQLRAMRRESNCSPRFFQQLGLLFLSGLTWRLYLLKWQIESIRRRIELAVDERQLALPTNINAQNATTTLPPASAA